MREPAPDQVAGQGVLPLSLEQRTVWYGQEYLGQSSPAFVISGRYTLTGPLDPELVERALAHVASRHQALRVFLRRGTPLPCLEPQEGLAVPCQMHDVSGLADPEGAAEQIAQQYLQTPFALYDGPLCRFGLIRLAPERHVFLTTYHHLTLDGWAGVATFNEIAATYSLLAQGRHPEAVPAVDYQEFLDEQRAYLASEKFGQDEAFWRQHLAGVSPEPLLAPLPGRPAEYGRSERLFQPLDEVVRGRLAEMARQAGTTVISLAVAGQALLLARLYQRHQVVVGLPFLNRKNKRARQILGHFTKLLPVVLSVDPDLPFLALAREVGQTLRQVMRHGSYPVEDLAGKMNLRLPTGAIFDASFNQLTLGRLPAWGQASAELEVVSNGHEPKVLGFALHEFEDGRLNLALDYCLNYLDGDRAEEMLRRFGLLLERAAEHPHMPVGDLDILLPQEARDLARFSRGPLVSRPLTRRVHEKFEETAARHPEALAVVGDGLALTYAQLNGRANRLAQALLQAGTAREEPVAVLCGRSPALAQAVLGIWKAGAAYLPLDPAYPAERIAFMLTDAGVRTVLAFEEAPLPAGMRVLRPGDLEDHPQEDPGLAGKGADLAYVIYTSGSTGRPKGVALTHAGFLNMILGQIEVFGLTPQDRVLLFASPSFDASLSEMFMALLSGAAICPVSRELIDSPWDLTLYMARHGVSVVTFPPSYLRLLEGADLPGLHVLITAGEPPHAADARHYAARLAYFNAYGPTEISVCATIGRVRPQDSGPISIGVPLPNLGLHILDRRLRPLPPGAVGQICLSGPGVARGYLNLPEMTAQRFLPAPWDQGERLYLSGDLGRFTPAGEVEYLGRADQQIKLRGQRVEPGEIEATLARHPAVLQAVVLPEGQTPSGGVAGLAAFLAPRPGQEIPPLGEMRDWLGQRLPAAWLPARQAVLAAIPLTASGKVDTAALRALVPQETGAQDEPVPPRTPGEAAVLAIWRELLATSPLGVTDDFFARGGDSLLAIRLARRLGQRFGVDLPARAVFANPTAAGLAALLDHLAQAAAGQETPRGQGLASADGLLSHGQAQILAVQGTSARPEVYNLPGVFLVESRAELDPGRWEAALGAVLARHEVLRTYFVTSENDGGEAAQRLVSPTVEFHLERADFSAGPEPLDQALEAVSERIHQPFDLARPPLLRAGLLGHALGRAVFYLCIHHTLADGHSLGLMVQEMLDLLGGQKPAGPALPFSRLVAEERAYLRSDQARADRDYWLSALTPPPPALPLPTDFPRPPAQRHEGARVQRDLPANVAAALTGLARQAQASLFTLFLALVKALLFRRTGQGDLVVGVPVSTRTQDPHESCVGFCVNTVAVRSAPSPEASFRQYLEEVRLALAKAMEHGAYPFDLVYQGLGLSRDPGRSPLFDVMAAADPVATRMSGPEGLSLSALDLDFRVSKFDLAFLCAGQPDGCLRLSLDYDSDLFLPATAAALLEDLAGLCREMTADPEALLIRPGRDWRPMAAEADVSRPGPEPSPGPEVAPPGQALPAVLQAWREVLGRHPRPQDDFFALGGDSIKAIQVCGRLRRSGWSASARDLFERPTPAALADLLARQGQAADPGQGQAPAAPVQAPLIPIQSRLWQGQPQAGPGLVMDLLLTTPSDLDPGRLQAALWAVARRHEAWRTVFEEADGGPRQRLVHAAKLVWQTRGLDDDRQTAQALEEIAPALQARLDPRRGRHLAAAFLRAPERGYLYLAALHLVVDGLSWRIILEDLATALSQGPAALPQPGDTFLAWAEALKRYSASPALRGELDHWRSVCATASLSLPLRGSAEAASDRPPRGRWQRLSARVDGQVLGGLASAHWLEQGARPSDLRLAALGLALGRLLPDSSPDACTLLALEGHGREPSVAPLDLSRVVGWFTCEYPLALPIAPRDEPAVLVERLRQALRTVPNGGVGFALLAQSHQELQVRPQIGFNDHGLAWPEGPFTLESVRPLPRPHQALPDAPPLSLSLVEADGLLHVEVTYQADTFEAAWVESLLSAYVDALSELAAWRQPGRAAPAQETLPLTPAQAGMYFQYLAQPGSRTYSQQMAFHLHGPAEMEYLARAWRLVASRHQGLRAVFAKTPEGTTQTILTEPPHLWSQADLSALPAASRQRELEALLQSQRALPLDLEQGPTLRACLARLSPREHVLVWSFHHILMDGWCIAILLNETLAAHQALSQGHPPDLPPAPPLRPYLAWLASHDSQADREYWRAYLEGLDEPTLLGGRLQSSASLPEPYRPLEMSFALERAASQGLQELAARLAVTQSDLIQAAWGLLLARHCDRRDVVFGVVTSGREAELEDMERLVGVCIRTLPVRLRLDDPQESLAALARRLRHQAAQRLPHETLHLAEIQTLTPLGADLFDHLLLFESYPSQVAAGDLRLGQVQGFEQLPYDLGLAVLPGQEIAFRFSFNQAVYGRAFIEGLGRRWLALLRALLEAPESPALSLPALAPEEARRLTRWAEVTRRDWPDARPVPYLFAERAGQDPGRVALVGSAAGGQWQVTYGELAGRMGQLAELLLAQGAGSGQPVAVCLGRGPDLPAALLAVQAVGAAYVPLDPLYPPERLTYILEDCGARLLLAETATAGVLGQAAPPGLSHLLLDQTPWGPQATPQPRPAPHDLAYIIYTSGSTGKPKGVEVTHQGLTNFLWSMAEEPGLSQDDTLLAVTTVCFDIAGLELFLPLIRGARIVLASREEAADAQRLMALLEQHQVSVLQATPTTWSMLMEAGWPGRPQLKALVGGEALSPRLAQDMLSRCGQVWNLYGPTETTIWSTVRRLRPADEGPPLVSIGTPLANTTAYILGRDLTLMPEGAVGELCLGGQGLARGYRNLPELTAQRFVTLPFTPFERIYRTGDLAAWTPEGELTYLGRTDFQVKVRGYRIELGEIENRLTAIPGVTQAVVQASDYRGAGTELAAWIAGGQHLAEHELRERLLKDLPYYMLPGIFVRLERMPLTPNGKIDRKALPNPLPEETPAAPASQAPRPPAVASAQALETMTAIWRSILHLTDLAPGDNFFHRGGHSLLAMRLVAAVEQATRISLPLRAIFEHPTLEAQAALLSQGAGQARPPIAPAPSAPDYPLSPAQHRLWALQRMSPEVTAYVVPALLLLEGEMDPALVKRAVLQAAHGHQALRSVIVMDGDEPRQRVLDDAPDFFAPDVDLSEQADPRAAAQALAQEMMAQPFSLEAPLIRARLMRLGPGHQALCLVLHHLVCDEWSLGILSRDIAAWLKHLRGLAPPPAPGPALGCQDYAAWLRGRLERGELAASRDWWLKQLAPPLPLLELSPDLPRPPAKTFAGGSVSFALPAQVRRDLRALAAQRGATEFAALATLVAVLLHRASNQDDLRLGVPMAGRQRPELQGMVGMLVNTLVLRGRLRPGQSFGDNLESWAGALRAALDHGDYPFDLLVNDLRLPHDPSRAPLFDVMVVLQEQDTLAPQWEGLDLTSLPLPRPAAKFDLSFLFRPAADGGLEAQIEYAADLFTAQRAWSLARQLKSLAASATADPSAPVSALNSLDPSDRLALAAVRQATAGGHTEGEAQLGASWPSAVAVPGGSQGQVREALRRLLAPGSGVEALRLTPSQAALLPGLGLEGSQVGLTVLYGESAGPAQARILRGLNPGMAVVEELVLPAGPSGGDGQEVRLTRSLSPDSSRRVFDPPPRRVLILDPGGHPCPLLAPGELCLGHPDATDAGSGPPFLRTGRRARLLADGRLELLGAMVSQGPDPEAAALVLETSLLVARAVVLSGNGQGVGGLRAFVLPMTPDVRTPELMHYLRERLPAPQVPERIALLERLPLTDDGRLDRAALIRDTSGTAAPGRVQVVGDGALSDMEVKLCALFARALGLPQAEPDTHFFAWGGDSLKAIRLCAAIEETLSLPCQAGELFRAPTPQELALRLEEARLAGGGPHAPAGRDTEAEFGGGALSAEELSLLRGMLDQ